MKEKNYYLSNVKLNVLKIMLEARKELINKGAIFYSYEMKETDPENLLTKWSIFSQNEPDKKVIEHISNSSYDGSLSYLKFELNEMDYYFQLSDTSFFEPEYEKKPLFDIVDPYGKKRSYKRYLENLKTEAENYLFYDRILTDEESKKAGLILVNDLLTAGNSRIVTVKQRKYYNSKNYYYTYNPVMDDEPFKNHGIKINFTTWL